MFCGSSEMGAVTETGKSPWLAASPDRECCCLPCDPCQAAGEMLNVRCTTQVSQQQNSLYCNESIL